MSLVARITEAFQAIAADIKALQQHVAGLGSASTAAVTTSATDATAGRVMKVGDFGLGHNAVLLNDSHDLNNVDQAGFYTWASVTPSNAPGNFCQMINVWRNTGSRTQIVFRSATATGQVWIRGYTGGEWRAWQVLYHTGNISTLDATTNQIFRVDGVECARVNSLGQLAVGTASPSPAAQFQINSTTRGFLPPRMTTTQRDNIVTPPAGLMVFNTTTNKLCCFDGATWQDCF